MQAPIIRRIKCLYLFTYPHIRSFPFRPVKKATSYRKIISSLFYKPNHLQFSHNDPHRAIARVEDIFGIFLDPEHARKSLKFHHYLCGNVEEIKPIRWISDEIIQTDADPVAHYL